MSSRGYRAPADRAPILLGCVGALVMSIISCCVLTGIGFAPALTASVPPSPTDDPSQRDITIHVRESFLNRAISESIPTTIPGEAEMDVQPNNRLVVTARFDLMLVKLEIVTTIILSAENGQIRIRVESVEAGGADVLGLLGVNPDEITDTMSDAIQEQLESGLGEGSQLLGIVTDEDRITIVARWAP